MDVYFDRWDHIILDELANQFKKSTYDDLRPLITKEFNIIKKVTNETAQVYKSPAIRTSVIDEGDENSDPVIDENYNTVIDETNIDVVMKSVNKMTDLSNQSLLKINWRNQKIDFDVLTFDNAEISTDPEDWKKIVTIKYFVDLILPEDQSSNLDEAVGKANPQLALDGTTSFGVPINETMQSQFSTMFLWTLEDRDDQGNYLTARLRKFRFQQNDPYFNEEIPYRDEFGFAVLPFVLFTKKEPINQLLDFTSGNDIWDGNLNIALSMIHLNELFKYQSYKTISITTTSPSAFQGKITLGPQEILKLYDPDGNTDVQVLDVQAAIKDLWQFVRERAITVFSLRGISPNAIRLSGTPESGFKVLLDKQTLLEMREDDIQIYRTKERETFKIIRIVNNVHNTLKINEKGKLKIDFAEIKAPESGEEKAKADTINIFNNTKTPIDFIMRDNPDLNRKEAERVFQINKEINSGSLPQGAELTSIEQPTEEEDEES